MNQNKSPDEIFSEALLVTSLVITITLFAFIGEDSKITGFAAAENKGGTTIEHYLFEFDDMKYLGYLPTGHYYIDNDGIVYHINENLRNPIAKIKFIDEIHKDRHVYVDDYGRVGYVLETK